MLEIFVFDRYAENERIQKIIRNFGEKSIPQSTILYSLFGNETEEFSKFLAQYIQCSNKNDAGPCFKCINCKKIENGTHPDVVYPKSSGATKIYGIQTVRDIRLDSFILPNEAKYKVYIFLDAQNLSTAAQNALLKILEEPPSKSIFLFLCNNLSLILPTVRSRSQIYDISFFNLHQKKHNNNDDLIKKLKKSLICKDEYRFATITSELNGDKFLFKKVIFELISAIRKSIELKLVTTKNSPVISAELSDFSDAFALLELVDMADTLNDVNYMLEKNVNFNLLLTYFVSSLF